MYQWSKFMEQVFHDAVTDPDGIAYVEISRTKEGAPVSIKALPNKACSGRLALWAEKIRELKNKLFAWLRGIIRRR